MSTGKMHPTLGWQAVLCRPSTLVFLASYFQYCQLRQRFLFLSLVIRRVKVFGRWERLRRCPAAGLQGREAYIIRAGAGLPAG